MEVVHRPGGCARVALTGRRTGEPGGLPRLPLAARQRRDDGLAPRLAFAVAGVIQSYLERVQGLPYMVAADPMRLWMLLAFAHGLLAVAGGIVVVYHLLVMRPARARGVASEALAAAG